MRNPKTTIMGLLAGLAIFWGSAVQARQADPNAQAVTLGHLAPAIAVAVLGAFAKDHNS